MRREHGPATWAWPVLTTTGLRRAWAEVSAHVTTASVQVPSRHLHDEWSLLPRTLAEQLGHLAEVARHLAGQTEQWLDEGRRVLGRGPVYDADREDAIERARYADLGTLTTKVADGAARVTEVLARLDAVHLSATVQHVVHGREPLVTLLTRDLLTHVARHADELDATLDQLPCCPPDRGAAPVSQFVRRPTEKGSA